MKAQLTINGQTIEVEFTTEQLQQLGVEEKKEQEVNKYIPFQPKEGEEYWYIDRIYGDICQNKACDSYGRHNIFRTKKAAEYEKLRQESMSKRWRPKVDDVYYFYSFKQSEVYFDIWSNHDNDTHRYLIGNVHEDKAEAEEWGKVYGEAWRVLL